MHPLQGFGTCSPPLINPARKALAESEWTPDAYRDALRRAWARRHAFDNAAVIAQPAEFAIPASATGGPAQAESVIPALPEMPVRLVVR